MLFDHIDKVLKTHAHIVLPQLVGTNYKMYIRDLDRTLFGGYLMQRVRLYIVHSNEIDVVAKTLMRSTGDVFIIMLNISEGINMGGDVGGITCNTVQQCIEQLLQHELMHVIVMRVNHELNVKIDDMHSPLFRVWLREIFGQHRVDNNLLIQR